ncbi:MAG TPA: hypothetical protein PLM29_08235, partial [Deltaproteobacteria bacterium]|nr:hypothetical protein [Deltaproteobacteria bacterium]
MKKTILPLAIILMMLSSTAWGGWITNPDTGRRDYYVGDAEDITYDNSTSGTTATNMQDLGDELSAAISSVGTTGVNFSGMDATTDTTGIDARQMILENSGTVNRITWANIINAIKASLAGFFQPADDDLTDLADGTLTGSKVATATDEAQGAVELSTDAESVTGTSDAVVVTPGTLTARLAAPGEIGGTTPAAVNATTISAGAGGFAVDADGDTTVKTI